MDDRRLGKNKYKINKKYHIIEQIPVVCLEANLSCCPYNSLSFFINTSLINNSGTFFAWNTLPDDLQSVKVEELTLHQFPFWPKAELQSAMSHQIILPGDYWTTISHLYLLQEGSQGGVAGLTIRFVFTKKKK